MNNDFQSNEYIVEIKTLLEIAEEFQNEIDDYCNFMKQTFLSTSGLN